MTEQESEALGLYLTVSHPASMPEFNTDIEGYITSFCIAPMHPDCVLDLTIAQGTMPEVVIALLRELMNKIERHGNRLLNLQRGQKGLFTSKGELDFDILRK